MKKVIFIGGTSYSGSTLLDMILANDPDGFSCGEVRALFHPWRPHHVNPDCGCGDRSCTVWQEVLKHDEESLYETLFDQFSAVFIVDSSKDLFWMTKQAEILRDRNIAVEHVLIWKTPLEFAHSFKKRGRLKEWKKSWINYHRAYFALVESFRTIKYSDLTTDQVVLRNLCDDLDIAYFDEKSQYWLKTHHTLFGNTAAKIHLYSQESDRFDQGRSELMDSTSEEDLNASDQYRSVYYNEIEDEDLIEFVEREVRHDPYFSIIESVLTSNGWEDGFDFAQRTRQAKMPSIMLELKHLRSRLFHSVIAPLKLSSARNRPKNG